MPYLFAVEVKYEKGRFILHNPSDLINNFPSLEGKVISGKFISMYKDGRIIRINKEFKCKLVRSGDAVNGEILEPNPIEALGLPLPSYFLIVGYKFEEDGIYFKEDGIYFGVEVPIAENVLLKGGSYTSYFEDEIKRILREEEAGLILEGTVFHPELEKHASNLKEALLSFEQENFALTKTSCRKILEGIKRIVGEWKTVDESESLCEKLKSVVSSMYSFASIGGPHEGVVTKEETEFILKSTTSLLFYINSLLKNQRIK